LRRAQPAATAQADRAKIRERTQGAMRLKTAGEPETAFNEDAKAA
jgi:hypothetical protein